jgi:hypothetical protein
MAHAYKAEIRRIVVPGQPRQKARDPVSKITRARLKCYALLASAKPEFKSQYCRTPKKLHIHLKKK